jgi:shikimate kinase
MQKNIVLVGFMGAGKSAVGQALAARLQRELVDLDEVIVERQGRPITQIFEELGEAYFRRLEKSLVKEISQKEGLIIACGGGVVLDKDNVDNLKRKGKVIYLQASPEVILKRTKNYPHRPLLNVADQQKKIAELLNLREPFYALADFTVDTSEKTIAQVVEEILKIIKDD